jgi:hypothetical protein
VSGLNDLLRQYEAQRFPPGSRLDLHGEGPDTGRDRALQWLQSRAHEQPGAELLIIVERGRGRGLRGRSVRHAVESLLKRLDGGLIEWWQAFGPGSFAVRLAQVPRLVPLAEPDVVDPADEGRTPETAGAAAIRADLDIPPELLPAARRVAELRREREGLNVGLLDVVLRRVWIEAQARAMTERIDWARAMEAVLREEETRFYDELG